MGIINHDTITLENGIEINDTYYFYIIQVLI